MSAVPTEPRTCACGCGQSVRRRSRFRNGHHRRKSPVEYIEADRGYETPCWIWQLSLSGSRGYGKVRVGDDTRGAHVVYWERENGPVPAGFVLDHLCHQRACVRPDHLALATHAQNARNRPTTKLTTAAVREIRAGGDVRELAERYGVTVSAIYYVRRGDTWRDVA